MKPFHIVFIATLIFASFLTAQGTYPLQGGNLWQYWTYDYLNGQYTWLYGWTEKVVGDTTLANGKKYSKITSDQAFGSTHYYRQDSSKVFQLYLGQDSLIYDFSKKMGDTILVRPVGTGDTLIQVVKDERISNYFGRSAKVWTYYMYFSKITYYEEKDLVDNLGIGYLIREAGDEWFLRGAVIDAITYGVIMSVATISDQQPVDEPFLYPNYPNPFNSETTIRFSIPNEQEIEINVYDVVGRVVRTLLTERLRSGIHTIRWDGRDNGGQSVASGLYVCSIKSQHFVRRHKMLLIK
jgi:hypothetical protein